MYYGQYELDRVLYERFFLNKKNGFFVECGAFDGLSECSCKFFEETLGWKGLNIEPTPYAYSNLLKNRPNSINENYALSSVNGISSFTNAIHPSYGMHFGNGSLNHSKIHMKELIDTGCKFETFNVECIRFIELYKKHSINNIDLFVLDVEGHEEDALQGILEIPVSVLPTIFCIEHTIIGLNKLKKILEPWYSYHSEEAHNAFFIKIK